MPSVLSRRHVAINTKRTAGIVPAVIQLSKSQPKKGKTQKALQEIQRKSSEIRNGKTIVMQQILRQTKQFNVIYGNVKIAFHLAKTSCRITCKAKGSSAAWGCFTIIFLALV